MFYGFIMFSATVNLSESVYNYESYHPCLADRAQIAHWISMVPPFFWGMIDYMFFRNQTENQFIINYSHDGSGTSSISAKVIITSLSNSKDMFIHRIMRNCFQCSIFLSMAPQHYLYHSWLIFIRTLGYMFQLNLIQILTSQLSAVSLIHVIIKM